MSDDHICGTAHREMELRLARQLAEKLAREPAADWQRAETAYGASAALAAS